jgi:hypothetical protein
VLDGIGSATANAIVIVATTVPHSRWPFVVLLDDAVEVLLDHSGHGRSPYRCGNAAISPGFATSSTGAGNPNGSGCDATADIDSSLLFPQRHTGRLRTAPARVRNVQTVMD